MGRQAAARGLGDVTKCRRRALSRLLANGQLTYGRGQGVDTFDFELSEAHMAELEAHRPIGRARLRLPFRYGPNGGAKGHPRFPWPEYFDSPEEAAARAAREEAALEAD